MVFAFHECMYAMGNGSFGIFTEILSNENLHHQSSLILFYYYYLTFLGSNLKNVYFPRMKKLFKSYIIGVL